LYIWLKLAHIVSATILFGTGLGTAFQMWSAHRSGNVNAIELLPGRSSGRISCSPPLR
jgi:uncharacterized membrane protein